MESTGNYFSGVRIRICFTGNAREAQHGRKNVCRPQPSHTSRVPIFSAFYANEVIHPSFVTSSNISEEDSIEEGMGYIHIHIRTCKLVNSSVTDVPLIIRSMQRFKFVKINISGYQEKYSAVQVISYHLCTAKKIRLSKTVSDDCTASILYQ
ncbi:Exostosin-1 [Dirofilaria immitis]